MSGWGIVAAGLGGGADSVGRITEGYIDQDRRLESARVLSQMEEEKQMRIAERINAMGQQNKMADVSGPLADARLGYSRREGEQAADVALKGKIAEAGSTGLTAAQIARETTLLKELTPAKIAAEKQELDALMGVKAKAAGMVARATDLGGAERAVRTELASLELSDKKRLSKLYDDFLAVNNDTTLNPQQRAAKLTPIANGIQAIKAKNGSARDPELDTETVKTKVINPDGSETETSRKQVRRPGAAADAAPAPYPDGTELKGKDGNVYVVRDGQPVLKNAAAPAKKAPGIVAAASNADPLAGLSREQIRDKRAELQSELTRWGDQPNAATRVAEIKTLLERIDNGQF